MTAVERNSEQKIEAGMLSFSLLSINPQAQVRSQWCLAKAM
jgi:hypothetical protein